MWDPRLTPRNAYLSLDQFSVVIGGNVLNRFLPTKAALHLFFRQKC